MKLKKEIIKGHLIKTARYLLSMVTFSDLYYDDVWYHTTKLEKIFRGINAPIVIVAGGISPYILMRYTYREVFLFFILTWFFSTLIHDASNHRMFVKNKLWPIFIANNIFLTIFLILVFDILYQTGLFATIQEYAKGADGSKYYLYFIFVVIFFAFYFFIFSLLTRFRMSIANLFPKLKLFFTSKKLGNIILDFILLSVFITVIFAALHYLFYQAVGKNSFSINKLNFFDILLYSFSIFYSSPISNILPNNIIIKLLTLIESLTSYSLLVLFWAFLINRYAGQDKIKNIKTRRHYTRRN